MPNILTQHPSIEFWVGDGLLVHNPLYPDNIGTVSVLVALNGHYFALCCCHVAQPSQFQDWPTAAVGMVEKGTGRILGTISPQKAFPEWDIALIDLETPDTWRPLFPKNMPLIADSMAYLGQEFVFSDLIKGSKLQKGILYEHRHSALLSKNLPLLGQKNKQGRWQDVSIEGNSGAVVFHEKEQKILGLVATGFIRGTYITKINFLIT